MCNYLKMLHMQICLVPESKLSFYEIHTEYLKRSLVCFGRKPLVIKYETIKVKVHISFTEIQTLISFF